jgi:hypothetical protein
MLPSYKRIAQHVDELATDIAIYLLPDAFQPKWVIQRLRELPSITFSPTKLKEFSPPRGPVFCGKRITKVEQMQLLTRAGVRTPKWTILTPDKKFNEDEWGRMVILKPNAFGISSFGRGIELVRTSAIKYLPPAAYPSGHPGRNGPMLVQQFIDTGKHSEDYRVITMFGYPLYAIKMRSPIAIEDIFETGTERTSIGVASNAAGDELEISYCYDQSVLDLASKVYLAIPHVPFQGVDIRKDNATGRLYCLEVNPGGNTWYFSGPRAELSPTIDGIRREDQFGAWKIAAITLIDIARTQAA